MGDVDKRGNKIEPSPSVKGYGLKIVKIELLPMSVYSMYKQVFERFPQSQMEALVQADALVQNNFSIRSMVQTKTPIFTITQVS